MNQTTVKQSQKIVFGSGKFEISEDGISWTDLGAMRGIVFTETWDKVTVMSDNAGEIKSFIKNHKASLAGNLMEIDFANLNVIRGGIDNYDSTPGVSETLKSGGKTTIEAIQAKVTNENEAGEQFRITVFKSTNNKGIELSFQPDDADDPNLVAIELQGSIDVDRTIGEQLFEIYNEQGEAAGS
jgi:hypothetical protein